MKGLILAAGEGTRMRPLTYRRPKPLVPVMDRPMIEHIIAGAAAAGVDDWCIIVGHLGEMLTEWLGDGSRLGVRISYLWQEQPTGTGAAALLAEEFMAGESFFLSWGDIMVPPRNYARVIGTWQQERPPLVLSVNEVDDPWAGAAVYVEDGYVIEIIEKPPRGSSTTNYNNAGLFVMPPQIFDYIRRTEPSARGERELPDTIQIFLQDSKRVRAVTIDGFWSDVASPVAVLEVSGWMILDRDTSGLLIDASAEIDPAAQLTPPLYVEPDCRIGAAWVGPNVCLLEGAVVAEGAKLRHCMLYSGAQAARGVRAQYAIAEENQAISGELIGSPQQVAVLPA